MGERVVISEPLPAVHEPPGNGAGATHPPQGVPLDYADPSVTPRWRENANGMIELARIVIQRIGGYRQIIFSLGLAFVLGGVGEAIGGYRNESPALLMFFGGLLLGLVIP